MHVSIGQKVLPEVEKPERQMKQRVVLGGGAAHGRLAEPAEGSAEAPAVVWRSAPRRLHLPTQLRFLAPSAPPPKKKTTREVGYRNSPASCLSRPNLPLPARVGHSHRPTRGGQPGPPSLRVQPPRGKEAPGRSSAFLPSGFSCSSPPGRPPTHLGTAPWPSALPFSSGSPFAPLPWLQPSPSPGGSPGIASLLSSPATFAPLPLLLAPPHTPALLVCSSPSARSVLPFRL